MAEDRAAKLAELAREIEQLTESPLYDYRQQHDYNVVLGEGNIFANIMFVGEAPGKKEAQTGRPFVGAAGRILDGLLASIELGAPRCLYHQRCQGPAA